MGVVRLVTFDFWQTLFADTPDGLARAQALRLAGVREALARAGHLYDAPALEAADTRALAALQVIWNAHRDVAPGEQARIVLEAIDPVLPRALTPADREAVEAAYAAPVLAYPPLVSPGAVEAARALAAQGITLGVISNTGRTPGTMLRRLLARAGIVEGFRVFSFSDEVGARKPAAEIFLRTLAAAGAAPGAALHVGDDAQADIGGARAVGMRAAHYLPDGRPGGVACDAVVRHFAELPAVLARLG